MPTPILHSLKASEQPHLYLTKIGLSLEDYRATSQLTSEEKGVLVQKILEHATDTEVEKIIYELAKLEFQVEPTNPFRAGQRLAAQLIRLFIEEKEKEHFPGFYQEVVAKQKSFSDFRMSTPIKEVWFLIKKAAQEIFIGKQTVYDDFMAKGFHILPAFYYQQMLPLPSQEELMRGARPIELTTQPEAIDALNEQIQAPMEEPALMEEIDLRQKLADIKNYILTTQWKVGNYVFFQGGVINEGKRLPHRVSDILNLIKKAEAEEGADFKATYTAMIECAQEALDKPRTGRTTGTTQFYQDVYHHLMLQNDWPLRQDLDASVSLGR
ncbi:hypothetical protein [Legionella oakridgensis]|uniref:Uncharacterized protein n=2 Tax=Legionella oakridgensis TaxID=29423 RepID=W0BDV6_9GAMM|nr:hypothetical protein [Legionella oakridgensis]AHE68055.1 hypothetical protein Loa_02518 [Legionella oakridgensis ATCC 33761 = DSM 21215]KTD44548.1 hypothetical protein Loak_0059 [Legionella oakridgensis]STY21041.1 Uncharacterised protein [Legionella longbeachae]